MPPPQEPSSPNGSPYVSIVAADKVCLFGSSVLMEGAGKFEWTIPEVAGEIRISALITLCFTEGGRGTHSLDLVLAGEDGKYLHRFRTEPLEVVADCSFVSCIRGMDATVSVGVYIMSVYVDGTERNKTPITVLRAPMSMHD